MDALQTLALRERDTRQELQKLFDDLKNEDGSFKSVSAETDASIKSLKAKLEEFKTQRAFLEEADQNDKALAELKTTKDRVFTAPDEEDRKGGDSVKAFTVPATVKRLGSLKSFQGERGGLSAEQRAYGFGQWFKATFFYDLKAIRWCRDHGVSFLTSDEAGAVKSFDPSRFREHDLPMALKAQNETTLTAGGALVPEQFSSDIIIQREMYGVFRRNAQLFPMTTEVAHVPRRTGPATAYWVSEGSAITESQMTFDRVNLTAKKLAALIPYTSELDEDSLIDVGDLLASEIAWMFALAEDQAGFNGDGTSTYGSITGLGPSFVALGTAANTAGLIIAPVQTGGNGWGAIRMNEFTAMMGRLPHYAYTRNDVKWYCSQAFWGTVMAQLAATSGGVALAEIAPGGVPFRFMGFPVEIAQVMPSSFAVSTISCYFGSLALAALFGDRRALTLATSVHYHFNLDTPTLRGTERIDIEIHDIGNNSATASLRQAGPIVALQTAAT